MSDVDIQKYFSAMIEKLDSAPAAHGLWLNHERWTNPAWTYQMTRALAAAARTALPKMHVAGKGIDCGDEYGRHEYLTMDLTVYDNNKWECPALIVEHENSPSEEKLQYCAWKLLSVYAKARILVAYIDTTKRYACYKKSVAELRRVLQPVLAAHPNKPLALFVGDWCAELGGNGFKAVFSNVSMTSH